MKFQLCFLLPLLLPQPFLSSLPVPRPLFFLLKSPKGLVRLVTKARRLRQPRARGLAGWSSAQRQGQRHGGQAPTRGQGYKGCSHNQGCHLQAKDVEPKSKAVDPKSKAADPKGDPP